MRTLDLIAKLQKLVDDHKPYEEIMGEHEIVIDVFKRSHEFAPRFTYAGFSGNIKIDKSSDGVYDILSAFEGDL